MSNLSKLIHIDSDRNILFIFIHFIFTLFIILFILNYNDLYAEYFDPY